jgi:hypothetical protein
MFLVPSFANLELNPERGTRTVEPTLGSPIG